MIVNSPDRKTTMNLGKRIDIRLTEMGKKRSFLFEVIPGLHPSTLSLLISRDSRRTKFESDIARALGVRLAWLRSGQLPKLSSLDGVTYAWNQQIADLILDDQPVQAVIRIFEQMNSDERGDLRSLMDRLENRC